MNAIARLALRLALAGASLALVAGCAALTGASSTLHALAPGAAAPANARREAIQAAWDTALKDCDSHMESARAAYYGSGKAEVAIASIGILAGSVVVPALAAKASAARSAVAAWGGVSGAANAAQFTLQQKGVSAARRADAYAKTRAEIAAAADAYVHAANDTDRASAVIRLQVACRYPALPGAEAPEPAAAAPGGRGGEP